MFWDLEKIAHDQGNVLFLEQQKAVEIYNQIMKMQLEGHVKYGHKIDFVDVRNKEEILEETGYPQCTLHGSQMTISGKYVSYEMLYAIVAKRFHSCMKVESADKERLREL